MNNNLYFLAEQIAQLTNPHLFYDLKHLPEVERLVGIEDLKERMEDEMRLKVFESFVK